MNECAHDRRMVVNPEPLRFVAAKAGEPKPPVMFMVMQRTPTEEGGTTVSHGSVHREGCSKIPVGESGLWTVSPVSEPQIAVVLGVLTTAEIPVEYKCRTCGGWN